MKGTHAERRHGSFIGSTTERVVRYAGCPVLVVRCPEHDFVSLTGENTANESTQMKRTI